MKLVTIIKVLTVAYIKDNLSNLCCTEEQIFRALFKISNNFVCITMKKHYTTMFARYLNKR